MTVPDPMHFDGMAERYDRARPPYPAALWERLRSLGVLRPGIRAIDVGAGSGQATGPLIAAGASVVAVEPGPRLAAILAARFPSVEVRRDHAESVDLEPGSFDLAVIATAVHWLDLGTVLPRLHAALGQSGYLVVFRNAYGDADAPVTPFRRTIEKIVEQRNAPPRPGPDESDIEGWTRSLEAGGLFRSMHAEVIRWSIDLDADAIHDLFATFSDWTENEAREAAEAARALGGVVREHYLTPLIVLDRAT